MVELITSKFNMIIELLDNEKVHCTFAYSVIEGIQQGKIYVDDCVEPKSYLIICKSGKYLVGGYTNNLEFNNSLSKYLLNKENHNRYFDIYSSSKEWVIKLDEILGTNAAKLRRQVLQLNALKLPTYLNKCTILDTGFEIRKIDLSLFERYVKEVDSSYGNLWGSSENFLLNGFGFCILKNNEFVSVCNSYYTRDGFAEIDVITIKQFRNQGFAKAVCLQFINYCIENNIKPIWDCDDGNENSKKLAQKLGFKSLETYEMHWWHENKKFVEEYLNNFKYDNISVN